MFSENRCEALFEKKKKDTLEQQLWIMLAGPVYSYISILKYYNYKLY